MKKLAQKAKKLLQEKWVELILVPLVLATVALLMGWLWEFPTFGHRLREVEKQVEKIENIKVSVGKLETFKDDFGEMTKRAERDVEKLHSESGDFVKSIQADQKLLQAEVNKFGQQNAEFKASIDVLKGSLEDIRKLRESIDALRNTVATLDATVKRHADRLDDFSKAIGRVANIADPSNEVTFAVVLDAKTVVETGNRAWQFRVPIPADVGQVVRVVRVLPVHWPEELGEFSAEGRLGQKELDIFLRGTFDQNKIDAFKRGGVVRAQVILLLTGPR